MNYKKLAGIIAIPIAFVALDRSVEYVNKIHGHVISPFIYPFTEIRSLSDHDHDGNIERVISSRPSKYDPLSRIEKPTEQEVRWFREYSNR